jgi:hypothetical protein
MQITRDTTTEPEGGLTIDCECCTLRDTAACDDCVVTFLLGRLAPCACSGGPASCPHCASATKPARRPWWRP